MCAQLFLVGGTVLRVFLCHIVGHSAWQWRRRPGVRPEPHCPPPSTWLWMGFSPLLARQAKGAGGAFPWSQACWMLSKYHHCHWGYFSIFLCHFHSSFFTIVTSHLISSQVEGKAPCLHRAMWELALVYPREGSSCSFEEKIPH